MTSNDKPFTVDHHLSRSREKVGDGRLTELNGGRSMRYSYLNISNIRQRTELSFAMTIKIEFKFLRRTLSIRLSAF